MNSREAEQPVVADLGPQVAERSEGLWSMCYFPEEEAEAAEVPVLIPERPKSIDPGPRRVGEPEGYMHMDTGEVKTLMTMEGGGNSSRSKARQEMEAMYLAAEACYGRGVHKRKTGVRDDEGRVIPGEYAVEFKEVLHGLTLWTFGTDHTDFHAVMAWAEQLAHRVFIERWGLSSYKKEASGAKRPKHPPQGYKYVLEKGKLGGRWHLHALLLGLVDTGQGNHVWAQCHREALQFWSQLTGIPHPNVRFDSIFDEGGARYLCKYLVKHQDEGAAGRRVTRSSVLLREAVQPWIPLVPKHEVMVCLPGGARGTYGRSQSAGEAGLDVGTCPTCFREYRDCICRDISRG